MPPFFESLQLIFDGSHVTVGIAFISGLITFFASCLLPLVPTYLAYLSGLSLQEKHLSNNQRWHIFTTGLSFVLGFIAAFVLLGLTFQQFAFHLAPYRQILQQVAGGLFILLGLVLLGLLKPKLLTKEYHLPLQNLFIKYRLVHAFITGVAFAVSWTPCIGPVLAVILYWASQTATALEGTVLLTAFGLGIGLPFLLLAGAFEWLLPMIRKYQRAGYYLSIVSALVIISMGVLLLLGQFQAATALILRFFNQHFQTF